MPSYAIKVEGSAGRQQLWAKQRKEILEANNVSRDIRFERDIVKIDTDALVDALHLFAFSNRGAIPIDNKNETHSKSFRRKSTNSFQSIQLTSRGKIY